jgi:CheY-like chemotaxis protein
MVDPAIKIILVVDDNREARDAVSELLTHCGYTVACAENGQAALDEIQRWGVPPALILLDLVMPVMDGYTFVRRVREDLSIRNVPIIVTTGDPLAQPSGADAVLSKPVNLDTLLSIMRRFMKSA